MVARPLQHVHRELRRIGHLQEEDLLARDVGDAGRIVAQRQRVEAVEDQAQRGMAGAPYEVPGLAVTRGEAAPCQRLEAHAQAMGRGAFGQRMQLRGGARGIVDGERRGVRAAQHQRHAQRGHQLELALGALQAAAELRLGHAFEIAERLVEVDRQAQVGREAAQLDGRALEVDEVALEQLDAVEARCGDRLELLAQRAAERDGGDRAVHARRGALRKVGGGLVRVHGSDFRNAGPCPQPFSVAFDRSSNAIVRISHESGVTPRSDGPPMTPPNQRLRQ